MAGWVGRSFSRMGQVTVPKLNIIKGPLACKAWTVKTKFLNVVSGVLGQKSGVLGQGLDGAWLALGRIFWLTPAAFEWRCVPARCTSVG